jgi:hypothetical protein
MGGGQGSQVSISILPGFYYAIQTKHLDFSSYTLGCDYLANKHCIDLVIRKCVLRELALCR